MKKLEVKICGDILTQTLNTRFSQLEKSTYLDASVRV